MIPFLEGLEAQNLPSIERVAYWVGLALLLLGNFFQLRYGKSDIIHRTDLRQISSLEGALARADADLTDAKVRAGKLEAEVLTMKQELIALYAIDVHELLEFAKMKRKIVAQEVELEELAGQLERRGGQKRGRVEHE
jgi:hypothetical protein